MLVGALVSLGAEWAMVTVVKDWSNKGFRTANADELKRRLNLYRQQPFGSANPSLYSPPSECEKRCIPAYNWGCCCSARINARINVLSDAQDELDQNATNLHREDPDIREEALLRSFQTWAGGFWLQAAAAFQATYAMCCCSRGKSEDATKDKLHRGAAWSPAGWVSECLLPKLLLLQEIYLLMGLFVPIYRLSQSGTAVISNSNIAGAFTSLVYFLAILPLLQTSWNISPSSFSWRHVAFLMTVAGLLVILSSSDFTAFQDQLQGFVDAISVSG